eukprot:scaffold5158_cov153-Amphora_coffeaeformis.AAC.7
MANTRCKGGYDGFVESISSSSTIISSTVERVLVFKMMMIDGVTLVDGVTFPIPSRSDHVRSFFGRINKMSGTAGK